MAKQDTILTVASLLRKRVVVKHDPMCSSGHTLTVTFLLRKPISSGFPGTTGRLPNLSEWLLAESSDSNLTDMRRYCESILSSVFNDIMLIACNWALRNCLHIGNWPVLGLLFCWLCKNENVVVNMLIT